ncbi:Uncharacterized protein DAT39_005008 [Clarias magur]|uniref:Uncharacterized protein n=1 Tax=Clarias magur TaxID=1594786 RepID=A0A8J4TWM3_CLAMG|nr:Uncharacterized protein DAT39_005008 [Clarias magur]
MRGPRLSIIYLQVMRILSFMSSQDKCFLQDFTRLQAGEHDTARQRQECRAGRVNQREAAGVLETPRRELYGPLTKIKDVGSGLTDSFCHTNRCCGWQASRRGNEIKKQHCFKETSATKRRQGLRDIVYFHWNIPGADGYSPARSASDFCAFLQT